MTGNEDFQIMIVDLWPNLSDLATQTPEVVYSPCTMRNNNMILLPPPGSRACDLIPLQQTSRALMPSEYSQLQSDSMAGINRAAFCKFSDHFASCSSLRPLRQILQQLSSSHPGLVLSRQPNKHLTYRPRLPKINEEFSYPKFQ